jgi:hypothetical protein
VNRQPSIEVPKPAGAQGVASVRKAEAGERRDLRTLVAELALPLLAVGSVLIWLQLQRWYGVTDKIAIPYFAFEKLDGQFHSEILRKTLALFILAALFYVSGFVVLARSARISTQLKIAALAFMLGPALVNIAIYPAGALDIFNYMVDLKLAYHYDANPYVVTMPDYIMQDPITRSAFLLHIPLFYGPAWLLLSAVPAFVSGFDDVANLLMALKTFNLLLLALTAWLIALAQPNSRRRWLAAFAFLANPLVIWEGIGNVHNDVMMTTFLIAAVYAMGQKPGAWLAAPAFALSALVKLFTLAAAPLFLVETLKRRWRPRQYAVGLVATVIVAVAVIAPFWDGGDLWDGMREGTRLSQKMDHVSPYSLMMQHEKAKLAAATHNPRTLLYASTDVLPQSTQDAIRREFTVAFLVLAVLVIAARLIDLISFERATALTLILFSLLMTNLYGWYLIPIVALLALELDPLGIAYTFAGTLLGLCYYPAYVWGHFNSGWSKTDVHLFLAVFLTAPLLAFLVVELVRIAVIAWNRRQRLTGPVSYVDATQ